ncbi:MAG TPA: hypothetical protein PLL69_09970 [Gemmatimonadales bacterium]|nr:hypothetical protein [Gemmatimonadales bacterium]
MSQTEDLAQPLGERLHIIAQSPLAERTEEGEVLADLGRGGPGPLGQGLGGDGGAVLVLELFEKAEVDRQAAHGGVGDLAGQHL